MMIKMLEDPKRDYAMLVRQFLDGFYGAASGPIREYLERLESASAAKSSYLSMGASPLQYKYLDIEFVTAASGLFDKAEQAVAGNDVLPRRLRHARLPLDRAIVVLYAQLKNQWADAGHSADSFPLDGRAVAARCKETWYAQIDFRIPEPERAAERGAADVELKGLAEHAVNIPLPEKFRDVPPGLVFQFSAYETRNWGDSLRRVQDAACETGIANRLELSDEDMKRYAMPMRWGLYDSLNKRGTGTGVLRAEDVPGPGYHWYKLGTSAIAPSCYLYFFWSWIIQIDIESVIDSDHPDLPFDIWANIKFEGPGFPHGGPDEKNAINIERVVLVRTQPK